MTAPHPEDRVVALAAELGRLGRHLDGLGAELLALHTAATTAATAATATAPPPDPGYAPQPHPGPAYPGQPHPASPYAGPAYSGQPYPAPPAAPGRHPLSRPGSRGPGPQQPQAAPAPPRRRAREWLSSLSGARLLAWTGAAVTLLGVVLFLALAASRGWFSPPVRVGAGAVLGVALVGVGARLHRRASSRIGALALVGTGIATLYLDVAAATVLYRYLPAAAGLLLALVVAAGGLALADRWRSLLLGGGAVVGAALLAPAVTDGPVPLLVALVLVLQVVATVVGLRRGWPVLVGVAAFWPVLYGTSVAGVNPPDQRAGTIAASLAVLLVGVAGAVGAGRRTVPLSRRLRIGLLVTAPLPALVYSAAEGWTGAAVAFAAAVVLLAAAALPGNDVVLRTVALAGGAVALLQGTSVALDGATETAVLLGQAVVLLVAAAVLRSRPALLVGGFLAMTGTLFAFGGPVPPDALADFPVPPFVLGTTPQPAALAAALAVSALVVAAALAVFVAAARTGLLAADAGGARVWVPAGLVVLYGAAGLVIAGGLLVAPTRGGFTAAHAVVTVSWTVAAAVLLARGVRRPALRFAGMVLVAAAVAKLVLFDLVALDGLARVAAFLGAGLLLLAAGTRYARLVAEAEGSGAEGSGAAGAGVSGEPPVTAPRA